MSVNLGPQFKEISSMSHIAAQACVERMILTLNLRERCEGSGG